jgi:hypothetical protein
LGRSLRKKLSLSSHSHVQIILDPPSLKELNKKQSPP